MDKKKGKESQGGSENKKRVELWRKREQKGSNKVFQWLSIKVNWSNNKDSLGCSNEIND